MIFEKRTLARLRLTAACFISFCGLALSAPPQAAAQDDVLALERSSKAFSSVVKKAGPAVVYISVEKNIKRDSRRFEEMFGADEFLRRFFGDQFQQQRPQQPQSPQQPQRPFKRQGAGSGFIISPDGLILTNNHVVEEADKITVKLADKREFNAKVVGTDPQSDVALIKIEGSNLPTLPLGNSNELEVGEWVIAIGSPFELSQSVTVGVVSATGRNKIGISEYENFIQTDAAINLGNSGGPLLNIKGQAVGINTAIFSGSGGNIGIGFAIPINMAKSIEEQLRSHGKVIRGWLGLIIQDVDDNLAQSFGLGKTEGILVSEVTSGSPAEKAGLKQGDVVLALNGSTLNDVSDLRNRIAMIAPGTAVTLDIIRDGRKQQVSVLIAEQPSDFSEGGKSKMKQQDGSLMDKLGLTLQELTPELAEQFGYSKGQGVLVAEVEANSPADNVGIEPGQLIEEVNRVRVRSFSDLKDALKKGGSQVLLKVRAGEFSRYVALKYEE
ncbi:DegQ family serine endoprotease [Candidatus Electronema sp. TJ]|uniref:DegQ family serine endoprotease n=1 Tax=Candidatus Electronema sp. TJ TaxID=3401573 RepID=UPI003AA8E4E1